MKISTLSVSSTLLSFLFLTACGGEGDKINDRKAKVDGPGNSLTESLQEADFQCVTSNCPKNIGLLVSNDTGVGGAKGQCTAFLIADDIVATNSHCIPESLKSTYYIRDCSRRLAIRFQSESGKKDIFKCKEMLDYSDYLHGSAGQDFAFFKISPTGRTPLNIHKKGIADNQSLSIQKISPLKYSFGGRLSVQKCRNIQNTFVNIDSTNPWSTSGVVVDCNAIPGNSGSPIVDTSGAVVGIAQANWKDSYIDTIRKQLRSKKITFGLFPEHILFTNLSCVKDPVTNIMDEEMCGAAVDVEFGQCIDSKNDVALSKVKEKIESWEKELSPKFVYKIKNLKSEEKAEGDDLTIEAEPVCAKKIEASVSFSNSSLRISTTYSSSMTLEVQLGIDDDLRFSTEASSLKKSKVVHYDIGVVFDEDKNIWVGEKTISKSTLSLLKNVIPVEMPNCTDEEIALGNIKMFTAENGQEIPFEEYRLEDDLDEEETKDLATCKQLGAL
jgi:hypothetical protein